MLYCAPNSDYCRLVDDTTIVRITVRVAIVRLACGSVSRIERR